MTDSTVRDWMHEGVISCSPDAGLEEVATIMREQRISAVVVMKEGAAVGIISQTDLVNAAFVQPYLRYWRGMAARHLMTSPIVSVPVDAPLAHAVEVLRTRRIHRVVVTESTPAGERPVGILSLTDIARTVGPHAEAPQLVRKESR
jgi:crotonyl-CoA carboxylase/reductase